MLKKLPYTRVRKAQGHDAALQAWTSQSSAPVAIWNDERPRNTWIEQLYLVERLAPEPALIPTNIEDRTVMFGFSNELCGEHGFGWSRRVMLLDATLTNPQSDDAARTFASYMGGKYGYDRAAAETAPARVAQILRLLDGETGATTGSRASVFHRGPALCSRSVLGDVCRADPTAAA